MAYLEELLPEFRKGAKIRCSNWGKDEYIQKKGGLVATDNDFLCGLSVSDIFSDRWELYRKPQPDWDYIIKNKCLCWFWERDDAKQIRYLTAYRQKENYPFVGYLKGRGYFSYSHCRPVRRDEVTFYEDRKND